MKDFSGKVVVITGGATGIGYKFAQRLGAEGAKIVLAGLREDRLRDANKSLSDLGVETAHFVCDVAEPNEIEALADFAWESFGQVDVIINNAGIVIPRAPVVDAPLDDVRRIFDVNFFGVWHGSATFGKRFIKQGTPAAIYNVGSENSLFHGVPLAGAYVGTKHAVLALTESLREELPDFIDVSLICPGFVRSELGPPEQMALGMDTDKFVDSAVTQLKAGVFYVVTHAYNVERIDARYREIRAAFDTYAPRYEGDDEFDVRTQAKRMQDAGN